METIIYIYKEENNYYSFNFIREDEMRDINNISNQIDTLAEKACRLLTSSEKEEFFKNCKDNLKPYYISGINKGKEREIYEVEGRHFNKIWELLKPYVFTSCNRSTYGNFLDREDAISDVKYEIFRSLQLYGPIYQNQKLSQRFKLSINNALTNAYSKKSKEIQFDNIISEEEENFDTSDNLEGYNSTNFWSNVPFQIRYVVEQLVNGVSLVELKKNFSISKDMEETLLSFVKSLSK